MNVPPPPKQPEQDPSGEPKSPPTRRVLVSALVAIATTLAGIVVHWFVPSAPPKFVSSLLDHPAVWAPLLAGLVGVVVITLRQPPPTARPWRLLGLGLIVALVPGIVLWVAASSSTQEVGAIVEASARRVSGRHGSQHDFAPTIEATAGDVIEVLLRVSVLERLPARDASIRIALDKVPTLSPSTVESITPGVTSRGLRVDVLDRPGVYGDYAVIAIVPAHGPVRLRPDENSVGVVPMRARTATTPGPAPPWPRWHTLKAFFSSSEGEFVTNLGEDDALDKITREFTDEFITFKIVVEPG
jgi:hypothetical protein